MPGPMRTRIGAVAGTVAVALAALLGGSALQPAPVSAAYCDDFPFLCTTYVVAPSGNGSGTVTTSDGFINCRSVAGTTSGTCSHRYVEDENGSIHIALTLTADAGDFACFKTQCAADTQNQSFGASSTTGTYTDGYPSFRHEDCAAYPDLCKDLTIEYNGNGTGSVVAGGGVMQCQKEIPGSGQCTHRFFTGNFGQPPQIYVLGTAGPGSEVCEDNSCGPTQDFYTVLYSNSTFTFTFNLLDYNVTVARTGGGSGRVISSPGGIDCGSDCTGSWTYGQAVTLSAAANAGSSFTGWTGACAGQDATCELTVTGASTSTATFAKAGGTMPPGATTPPGTTPNPAVTPRASTPATGATPLPGATDPVPPLASGDASPIPGGTLVPGATGAVASTLGSPNASTDPGGGQSADERGPDITLLAVAILLAAVIIAVGLAVGLRGRRPRAEEPPAA